MQFMYWFGRIIRLLLVINVVFVIHEYGHLSELRKRNIPVQELSIGAGPILYQWQGKDMVYTMRAISIGARIRPTERGTDILDKLPFIDFFLIYSAGVRNNILVGLAMILILFWSGVIQKQSVTPSYLCKTTLKIFFDTVVLFACFFGETFTRRKYMASHLHTIPIPITPPYFLQQFLYWSVVLGLWNIFPLYPLDGGHIFAHIVEYTFGSNAREIFTSASFVVFMFIFWRGFSNIEFVEYGDPRYTYRYKV